MSMNNNINSKCQLAHLGPLLGEKEGSAECSFVAKSQVEWRQVVTVSCEQTTHILHANSKTASPL